jgi:3-oxoadipate enol-lactonase
MELTISGRQVAFDIAGEGIPIVLLHAFPLDRRLFTDTAQRLAPKVRIIVPDLRGFGASELGGSYTIADLADDVAALLDALGHPRAVIGGLSMGGYVALAFAARHAGRLAGLVLADTRAGADSPEARAGRDEAIALVREHGVAAYVDKQLPRLLGPKASESVRAQVRSLGLQQRPEAVMAGLEALRDRPDRQGELGAISCPALVIVGADDVITPPAEVASMATTIPGAVLAEIPDAGHLANLQAPAPFAQAIIGFLPRVSPR